MPGWDDLFWLAAREYQDLFWLASRDVVYFSDYNEATKSHDSGVYPYVLCSDSFAYACADGETIPIGCAHEVREVVERFGVDGALAWCARQRNTKPLPQLQTDAYKAARKWLESNPP